MAQYIDLKTGTVLTVEGEKFSFPTTGANILLKPRPPIAKEVRAD